MSATSFPIGSVEGQIAELNEHIATSSVPITLEQSINWGIFTEICAYRSGNIVVVTGVLNIPTGGLSNDQQFASISSALPNHKYWFPINGNSDAGRGAITTEGAIIAEASISAGYHSINFTYAV